jgi:hypothetical protein
LPRPAGPGSGPSPSAAVPTSAIPADGIYQSEPIPVATIMQLLAADTKLSEADRTSIVDVILGLRSATTFQSAFEVRDGDQWIGGQRVDAEPFVFGVPWPITSLDPSSIKLQTDCCGNQTYRVAQTPEGIRLTAVSPASSDVETFVRHITFELSPFTRTP